MSDGDVMGGRNLNRLSVDEAILGGDGLWQCGVGGRGSGGGISVAMNNVFGGGKKKSWSDWKVSSFTGHDRFHGDLNERVNE